MKYEALAQPGKIGKLEIKNRIVMPALNNNYTHNAFMTEESIDFYVARARGGAGLVIVEATSVDYPRSRSVLNPAIDDEKYLPGFKAIADGCVEHNLLGHGAGNVVYRLAKAKEMDYIDAGKALCEGKLWDEAAAQF